MRKLLRITIENQSNWHNATEQNKCNDGSWKDYWKNTTGETWPSKCCKVGCTNCATDGAHVQNSLYGKEMYIVPLCHECNAPYSSDKKFSLKQGSILVRANQSVMSGEDTVRRILNILRDKT